MVAVALAVGVALVCEEEDALGECELFEHFELGVGDPEDLEKRDFFLGRADVLMRCVEIENAGCVDQI